MITFTRTSTRKGVAKLGEFTVHTPALVIPTNLYSIRNLTRDMFDQVLDKQRCVLEVYYEDVFENWAILRDLPMPFKRFANLDGYPIWLALRETKYFANTDDLHFVNSDDTVSCVNHGGVCKLPIGIIKEMAKAIQPEAIIAPIDHFELPGTSKRVNKSIARTEKYKLLLHEIDSTIPSIVTPTSSVTAPLVAVSGVSAASALPTDLKSGTFIRGTSLPFAEAVELLRAGRLDFMDATFAIEQAERGIFLNLPVDYDANTVDMQWIDVNDKKWEADTSLLCAGCACPGCQFMRAYVHHLFVVREMLGPAVLTAHNLHQLCRFLSKL